MTLSLVSGLLTHVNINYSQLFMTSTNHLKAIILWKIGNFFLDISKGFHRVWHDGLIYRIKSFGISDTPLKFIENFYSNRYQRVGLNGQSSFWAEVSAGGLLRSVLGPLFFLIYIKDLSCGLSSTTKLLLMIHPFSPWSMMSHNLPKN